jgi:hypothetical protein
MRVTLKAVNDQVARRDVKTVLAKDGHYFFFRDGEAHRTRHVSFAVENQAR